MPCFSIIVPIYNVEPYVEECLRSLQQQTFDDFEALCVIDGSTDGSQRIAERFAAEDGRFHVLVKENGGLSSARNFGLAQATGDIILFVDADDSITPDCLQVVRDALGQTGADVLVFGGTPTPAELAIPWHEQVLAPPATGGVPFSAEFMFAPYTTPFVWRNAVKRSLLQQTGIVFDESLPFGEDIVFQFALYPRAEKLAAIPNRLYRYRLSRAGSLMSGQDDDLKRLRDHARMLEPIFADWKQLGLAEHYADELFAWSVPNLTRDTDALTEEERHAVLQEARRLWDTYLPEQPISPATVKSTCMCRGDGKLYALYRVQAAAPFAQLECTAHLRGAEDATALPASAYPLTAQEYGAEQDWVVELPFVEGATLALDLRPDGRRADAVQIEVNMKKAKWASRLNYRTHAGLCAQIRDFERSFTYGRYLVQVTQRFEAGADAIWRLKVQWIGSEARIPELALLDAEGGALPTSYTFCELSAGSEQELKPNTLYLSLRTAAELDSFIVVARDAGLGKAGACVRPGFAAIEPERAASLQAQTANLMMSAADDVAGYRRWYEAHRAGTGELLAQMRLDGTRRRAGQGSGEAVPLFSIVVAGGIARPDALARTVRSIERQTFGNWELIVAGTRPPRGPEDDGLHDDERIVYAEAPLRSFPEDMDGLIARARGRYVSLVAAGDLLEPDTLHIYAAQIAQAEGAGVGVGSGEGAQAGAAGAAIDIASAAGDAIGTAGDAGAADAIDAPLVLFCDEDALDPAASDISPEALSCPVFKSRLNADLLLSYNWVGQLACFDARLVAPLAKSCTIDARTWLYERTLHALRAGAHFTHVPHLLYHACTPAAPYRTSDEVPGTGRAARGLSRLLGAAQGNRSQAMQDILREHLAQSGISANVGDGPEPCTLRVRYSLPNPQPRVSIIIPNKDQHGLLRSCVGSIRDKSTYGNYEIVIVENNSTEDETFALYDELQRKHSCVRVVKWPGEFNYSKIVNFGAEQATGDYLLFLNNDTEVIEPRFIEELMGPLQRPEVGVVGAKLLFRDGLVQHAGIEVGTWGAVVHVNQFFTPERGGYLGRAVLPGNFSAVTGACQMVRAELYRQLGGYDPAFAVGFNDVDFCLRAQQAGYLVTFTPYALLHHYEFASRGREAGDTQKMLRWQRELALFMGKWPGPFAQCDPYTGPSLMHDNTYYRLD